MPSILQTSFIILQTTWNITTSNMPMTDDELLLNYELFKSLQVITGVSLIFNELSWHNSEQVGQTTEIESLGITSKRWWFLHFSTIKGVASEVIKWCFQVNSYYIATLCSICLFLMFFCFLVREIFVLLSLNKGFCEQSVIVNIF